VTGERLYVVEVVELATNKVVETLCAPQGVPQWKAERVMGGMDINLDHARFVTRVMPVKP
jgi:hypothetical protein